MPLVSQMQHKNSLDFRNQHKVVYLRDKEGLSWEQIAEPERGVRNMEGEPTTWKTCSRVYADFKRVRGRTENKYSNCGRKASVFTKAVKSSLVKRLLQLRMKRIVTATVLQAELASAMGVRASPCGIRKVLRKAGYFWLKRRKKPVYNSDERAARVAWALQTLTYSDEDLRKRLSLAMDGLVLTVPPRKLADRHNHCWTGDDFVYRQRGEGKDGSLDGHRRYAPQGRPADTLPLWAGISDNGAAIVLSHIPRKLDSAKWAAAVEKGGLDSALLSLWPARTRGPWVVLCDHEKFLHSKDTKRALERKRVTLWHIPPRSPDLNPAEKYWGWLRKRLRAMDLADLQAKRPPVSRAGLLGRVRSLMRSAASKRVARAYCRGLKKVCREVVASGGAASSG